MLCSAGYLSCIEYFAVAVQCWMFVGYIDSGVL